MKSYKTKLKKQKERDLFRKAVLDAAQRAGGQFGDKGITSYLEAQAVAAPSPFINLLAKMLSETQDQEDTQITRIEIVAPKTNAE